MAATAVAQRQARSTSAPARRSRSQARPRRPLRAVRTATAISDAADSRLIVRLTRSQAWIAIVGALLIGIVALNVYNLGMGSVVSSTAARSGELERENSLLRERIGKLRKNGEIERYAAKIGLGQPTSEELIRVTARKGDAKRAAARLKGEVSSAPVVAGTVLATAEDTSVDPAEPTPPATEAPATTAAADPAEAGAASAEPAPAAPETTDASVAAAGGVAP